MNTALRKALLTGIGAAVITKEKAEAAFADFVKSGKLDATDARAMARKLAQDGRKEFAATSREVEARLRDLATRADVVAKTRLAELEARIAELERTQPQAAQPKPRPKSK